MSVESVLGALIAFICAAFAVGLDAQTEIATRLGRLYGTSILRTLPGFLFIIGWGAVDVVFYLVFLFNHDWANRAFNITVSDNLLWTGVVVGFSAVLIIRTNLGKIGSVEVGGEFAYSRSRAELINRLNLSRARARRNFLRRYRQICEDVAQYPSYFSALEKFLVEAVRGNEQRTEIEQQLVKIKEGLAEPTTPDTAPQAREDITGVVYDYFGPKELDEWARESDYGQK
jgi:hypothetical protein